MELNRWMTAATQALGGCATTGQMPGRHGLSFRFGPLSAKPTQMIRETAMRMLLASTLMVPLGLVACASTGTGDHVGAATCSAEATATLVGQVAPDDATILRRTGGTIVRRIAPGDMTTRDYRVDRVTVTIADLQIVSASCG